MKSVRDDSDPHPSSFEDMGLPNVLLRSMHNLGLFHPSRLQSQAIPSILSGRDVVVQSSSRSEKTLSWEIGILSKIDLNQSGLQVIVMTHDHYTTGECLTAIQQLTAEMSVGCMVTQGGMNLRVFDEDKNNAKGLHIIMGTLARILDLLRREWIPRQWVKTIVIDEADLDFARGLYPMITDTLNELRHPVQIVLMTTDLFPEIADFIERYMKNPVIIYDSEGSSNPVSGNSAM
jgi:ATP-dependent RNA helicase DeaD